MTKNRDKLKIKNKSNNESKNKFLLLQQRMNDMYYIRSQETIKNYIKNVYTKNNTIQLYLIVYMAESRKAKAVTAF